MRWERIRPLIAALLAAAVPILDACNGPGRNPSGGGGGGGGGGTPSPFYMAGKANVAAAVSVGQIGFSLFQGTGATPDPYDLVVVDSAGLTASKPASGGTWLPMASVAQWTVTPGSGQANSWAPRYLVYAQLPVTGGTSDAPLYLLDLAHTGTSSLPTAGTVFSTASTISSSICTFGQASGLVLNDLETPSKSWVTLRVAGPDQSCASIENQTIAIPLTAGPTTAPLALGLAEPVEAIHVADGSLSGAIELVHILSSNVATQKPVLQLADANLNSLGAIGTSQPMAGTGNTSALGADFQSLGITIGSQVFLYRDAANVMAISLRSSATAVTLFTLASTSSFTGDTLQPGRALFDADGTTAYVAVNNNGGSSHVVRIDTSVTPPTATTVVTETTAINLQLVGLTATTGYLVYSVGGQPQLKAIQKTASAGTALSVTSLGLSQSFDAIPPVVIGDRVYYTVLDNSGTGSYRQLYSATFNTGGVSAPMPFAAPGGGCTVMIRPIYGSSVSTIGTPAFGSALLASGSSFCQSGSATLAYASAQLFNLDGSGNATAAGQLPRLNAQLSNPPPGSATAFQWVDAAYFFGGPASQTPVDGPLQAGLPVLLELDGATGQPQPAIDIEMFVPGSAAGPTRLTTNLQ